MKNTTGLELDRHPTSAEAPALAQYRIYRQTSTGTYTADFDTCSATEAVEIFLNQSPAFEGGEIRIWNQREQRLSASVEWSAEKTDFGFPVLKRTNVFRDQFLALIARQIESRENVRAEFHRGIRMTA